MNIFQLQDMLKVMPDSRLQQELQSPTGDVPQYLVLSEVVRRDKLRTDSAPKPSTTVVQDVIGQAASQPQAFASGGFVSPAESMGNLGVAGYPTPQPKIPNPVSASTGISSMFAPNPSSKPPAPQTVNNVQMSQPQPKFDDGQSNTFDSPSYYEQGSYADGGAIKMADAGLVGGNAGLIAARLNELGYPPAAIAAILGGGKAESSFNPAAVGKAGELGIFQWKDARKQALLDFAKARGTDPTDVKTQVDFLDHELRTTEKRAGNTLLSAKTPEEAAIGMMHFERPKGYTPDNPTAGSAWKNRLGGTVNFFDTLFNGSVVPMAGRETTAGLGQGAGGAAIGRAPQLAAVQPNDVRRGGIMGVLGLQPGQKGADTRSADLKTLGANMVNQEQPAPPQPAPMAEGDVQGLARLYSDPGAMASSMADYSKYITGMAGGGTVRMADGTPIQRFGAPSSEGMSYPTAPERTWGEWWTQMTSGISPEILKEEARQRQENAQMALDAEEAKKRYLMDPKVRDRINAERGAGQSTPEEAAIIAANSTPSQYQILSGALERSDKAQREYYDKLAEMQRKQMEGQTDKGAFLRQLGIGMLTNTGGLGASLNAGLQNAISGREQAKMTGAEKLSEYELAKMKLASETDAEKAKLMMDNLYGGGLTKEQQAQYLFGKIVELRNKAAEDPSMAETVKYYDSVIGDMMRKFGLPGLPGADAGGTSAFDAVVRGTK